MTAGEMLDDINEAVGVAGGIELTPREEEFLADMEDLLADDRRLTDGQMEWLERIWNRV